MPSAPSETELAGNARRTRKKPAGFSHRDTPFPGAGDLVLDLGPHEGK